MPRAPRALTANNIHDTDGYDDDDEDDDVEEIVGIPTYMPPEGGYPMVSQMPSVQPARKLPAGGKKAKLAVELKMNLEIELELKAYIHGDVTLELFN